jgi:hypothetical protein
LIKLYTSIWLDITWLKSTWEWLWSVITFWVWYVKNDPYLKAQAILQKDLKAVWTELNPLRKFEKLKKIWEKIKGFKKVKNIFIDSKWLKHILDRHSIDWVNSAWKSIFKNKNEIEKLIRESQKVSPVLQKWWNYQRIVKSSKNIWIDRVSWKETNIYTVITDKNWKLITAFPWNP